jgi:hypothetical protein
MNKKEIKPVPSSREARIGCGLTFVGYGIDWSDLELQSNHRKGKIGVPCAEWNKDEMRYRYYVLED